MAKESDSSSTEIPTEVMSNLCSKTCMETVKRYRDHNQTMSDDLKRLERDIKDYVRIVESFEEQIKVFQANELQHSYDTNYWKWEKNDLELQLKKSKEENEKIKSEFEKAKLDIEKFSNASKAMDSLLQTQIHDKLRRGIGYNTTPPPYNNNYIPPISDLLETKNRKELSDEATKVDPLDKVVVKTDSEEENFNEKSKKNTVSGEIPLENNIITNEGCGKAWIKSKDIEKTEGKNKRRNQLAEKRAPLKSHAQNKFANTKKNAPNKPRSNLKTKKANNFVQVWVPIVKKPVSTAISDSTTNRNSVAATNTTANKDSASTSINVAKPIILTKYSRTWTAFKFFKRFDGGHVTFDPTEGKKSEKDCVNAAGMCYYCQSVLMLLISVTTANYCLKRLMLLSMVSTTRVNTAQSINAVEDKYCLCDKEFAWKDNSWMD
ncbi:hypothetical protein L6452_08807 [Arctium lappa]|uniref:Uncharacterized protein n=1 Tax=Arctium lappa TaxID=4217 RepID=A0ACB9DIR9_ARCLA|nr:hypothetical protein L6452_08807 [Arctium lappa]